ncbi:MAG: hypothetical protein ACXADA_05520 [Candidatus Hodarchaeales archaeon]
MTSVEPSSSTSWRGMGRENKRDRGSGTRRKDYIQENVRSGAFITKRSLEDSGRTGWRWSCTGDPRYLARDACKVPA